MWNLENTSVSTTGKHSDRVKNYFVCEGDRRLNYDEVIELWVQSDSFNEWYTSQLTSHPSKAIRWETPCLTVHNLDRDFEFVLVDSPGLDRPVNQRPFAEKFKDSKANSVITFPNLGRNGIMVVPTPEPENRSYYCHLLSFLRGASTEHCNKLWRTVGETMRQRVNEIPVWLSTAGGGVAWLHVRLDNHPKYYSYAPYRTPCETKR